MARQGNMEDASKAQTRRGRANCGRMRVIPRAGSQKQVCSSHSLTPRSILQDSKDAKGPDNKYTYVFVQEVVVIQWCTR